MIVGVDARGVAIRKSDLNRVIPYLRSGLSARLGLEHGQRRRRCHSRGEGFESFFLAALVVAGRAGTLVAQIRKIVMAGVAVSPGDVYTGAARYVNFDASWLFSQVERSGHLEFHGCRS